MVVGLHQSGVRVQERLAFFSSVPVNNASATERRFLCCRPSGFEEKTRLPFSLAPGRSYKRIPGLRLQTSTNASQAPLVTGHWWPVVPPSCCFSSNFLKASPSPSSVGLGPIPYFSRLFLACWTFHLPQGVHQVHPSFSQFPVTT